METRAVQSPALAPLLRRRVTRDGRGVATAPPLSSRPAPRPPLAGELVGRPRVVDGAMMARFSNAWIGYYLEKPATMLLTL